MQRAQSIVKKTMVSAMSMHEASCAACAVYSKQDYGHCYQFVFVTFLRKCTPTQSKYECTT